ncbi:MAG: hypothetical protein VW715_02400 [Rhodospirillales bacterium]
MAIFSLKDLRSQVSPEWQKVSDEELVLAYAQDTGQDAQTVAAKLGLETGRGSSALGAGFGMGVDQAQAMIAGTGAALADRVGATGVRDALEAEARQQQAQSYLARNPEVAQRVEDIQGLGDVPGYVAGQVGQQIPIIGGILGASALGTLAGGPVGGVAAGLGTSYTYGVGSLYNEALEGGERKTAEALTTAVPYAAAEALLPLGLGRIARAAGSAAKTRRGAIAKAGAGGAITEAATEAFQTSLEIGMRDDLSPEEIYSRYLNAAVSGGLVGGGFSGVGGAFAKLPKKETDPDADVTDTDVDTGPVDTAPENNIVPDAEGGVNLAGSQAEVDANRVAQEQDAELRELTKAEWRESLLPLTGRKLTRGDRRKLEGRKKNLEYDLEVAEEQVAPSVTPRYRELPKTRRRRVKEMTAERRAEIQQELNNINTQLVADNISRMAEADLTGLDNDVTPVERAIAEAEQRAQAEAEAAQRVQGDVSPEIAPETLEEGVDLAQQVAPAARPETEVAPEPAVEPVQAVSPVVETEPAVEPVQAVSPVVETEPTPEAISPVVEEELVTAEDIEAEAQVVDKALKAEVKSEKTKVVGPITIEQPVIAAAARLLRNPSPTAKPIIYEEGTANPTPMTDVEIAQLTEIREAALQVAGTAARYNNSASNIINLPKDTQVDSGDTAQAIVQLEEREGLRADLVSAVERFINAAGGRPNANAIIAAYKATREKSGRGNPTRELTQNEADFINSIIPSRRGKFSKLGGFTTTFDSLLSNAFNQYVNDKLQYLPDIAPSGLDIKANRAEQKKEAKAGIRLFEKDLQETVERGRLANNLTETPDVSAIDTTEQVALEDLQRLRDGIDLQEGEKKITKGEYLKRRANIKQKADVARAEIQAYRDDMRMATKGVEALVNRALDSGTRNVTERLFAKMIRRALASRKKAGVPEPSIEFDPKESSFNPKTNTITLARETSPEVVLHEVLHALLQGYVYSNRSSKAKGADPATVQTVDVLRGYVKALIGLDLDAVQGLTDSEKATASEVIGVLRNIINRGGETAEVDAILELISYGNTLRDFKTMLTKVDKVRNEANATWKALLNDIWEAINTLLNKLIGRPNNDSAANDILSASVELLQGVTAKPALSKPRASGAKLRQEVGRRTAAKPVKKLPLNGTASPAEFNIDLRDEVAGKDWVISSKVIFDLLGWDKRMKWSGEKLSALNKYIKKNLPWVESFVRGWEPTYGDKTLGRMIDFLKSDKHNGYLRAEVFADIIMRSDKELVQDMFAYLDGNKKALEGNPHREQYEELLDSLQDFLDTYIEALPEKERDKFTARPLSESLLFVETKEDIGSQTIGKMRKISSILSRKREIEDNIEEQLMFDEDGVLNTQDAIYVRAIKYDKDGKEVDKVYARADIAAKTGNVITFENNSGNLSTYVVADPDARYKVAYTNDKKRYVFTTNMSAKQLLRGEARREDREKLANAVRNTVATLANSYSSGEFISALAASGRKADGTLDISESAEPVYVFDSVEELNAYSEAMAEIDGYVPKVYEGQLIPTVGDSVATESRVGDTLRVTGSYVKFPPNEVIWGELAGKIVSGPVYSAMHDATNKENIFQGDLARKYNTTVRWFKKSKTIYNPSTIVTNVASNVTLMLAHGIRPSTVSKAAKLLKRYYVDKDLKGADLELMSAFMNSGALLGNFSSQEVKESLSQAFADNMYEDKAGVHGIVAQLLNVEKAKAQAFKKHVGDMKAKADVIDDKAIGFYAYGDNIFRMAAFMDYVGKIQADNGSVPVSKAQLKEAGIAARKMFLDYDIDSRYLQLLRQTIVPFASWTYAIMPVLSKIIVTQPWKLANIMGAYAMIDTVASALVGDDDEETRRRMGELYNERLFGIGPHAMIRVPFFGDEDNPVYIKLGNYIPLHSTFKGTPNGTFGIEGWPSGLAPTGPIISAISMAINKDSYTGREIWGSTDSAYDRMIEFGNQVTDIVLPPIIASNARKKYEEALEGKLGITGGRNPSTDPTMVVLQAFGLKLYQPNTAEEAMWKKLSAKKAVREYQMAMSRARREMARSGTYDAEALAAELERLREDMLQEIDEVFNRD